jgi:hypothetical protein
MATRLYDSGAASDTVSVLTSDYDALVNQLLFFANLTDLLASSTRAESISLFGRLF